MAVGVGIFALGGVPRWAQAMVAALTALAVALGLSSCRFAVRISPLSVVLSIAVGLTAVQLIPLPSGVLHALTATGTSLRAGGGALLGFSPWPSLSLDPAGTLCGLTFLITLLGLATVLLRISTSERGRYWIIAGVTGLCGLAAVTVALHTVLGASSLYGLYEPRDATPPVLGPLLNPNNLGCLMAMGAVLGIGLSMARRQRGWLRAVWLVTVAACAATAVGTQSRGATLALTAGVIITFGIRAAQRMSTNGSGSRRRSRFVTSSLPIGIVAACGVAVVVYSTAGDVTRDLERTSLSEVSHPKSKFAAWRSAETLIGEAPVVGVGRGAFESSFTRVHPASGFFTFSHLENEYLQGVVDWGIPGALLIGMALVWLVAVVVRRWNKGPLAASAIGALSVLAIQSNVDFGAEFLGVAGPEIAISATLAHVPPVDSAKGKSGQDRLGVSRLWRVGLIASLVAGAIVLLAPVSTPIEDDHAALDDRASVTLESVRSTLERHPLDYYGYAVASEIMARQGDARAIPVLNHAMLLHPTHPGLHWLAARLLYRAGRKDQAAVEYASALRATTDPETIIKELVPLLSVEQAARAIPADFSNVDAVVRTLEGLQRTDIAARWLKRVLERSPDDVHTCELLYDISLRHGDLTAAEIAGRRCATIMPSHQTRMALARVLYRKSAYSEVIPLLKDVEVWPGRVDEKARAWLLLCDAQAKLSRWEKATRCLHRLDATGYLAPQRRRILEQRLQDIKRLRQDQAPPSIIRDYLKAGTTKAAAEPPPGQTR